MKTVLTLAILIISSAANSQSTSREKFDQMQWLVGSWKGMAGNDAFYEAWRRVNDSVYVNFSIEFKNGDTVVREGSPIHIMKGEIFLGVPPTYWKLTKLKVDEIKFENDTLKFSNKILWQHTKDDHWFTELKHPKTTVTYDLIRMPELDGVVDRFIQKMTGK
jgi:hypothetical protein